MPYVVQFKIDLTFQPINQKGIILLPSLMFENTHQFIPYSREYWLTILFFALLGGFIFTFAKKQTEANKWLIGEAMSWTLVATFTSYMLVKIRLGTFDAAEDLPFHLCNVCVYLSPFFLHTRRKELYFALFCWVMSGTLQGIITPNIAEGFPHFNFLRYWLIHGGLVMLMLYSTFILGFRMTFKGAMTAFFAIQLYAIFAFSMNFLLRANYAFLNQKPAHASLFDVLGGYPYYLISLEGVAILLFLACWLPFWIANVTNTSFEHR
ncbi:MAG: hypothetical protein RI894_1409 [Bacteroidota bacterium]|jgi:hypothetical integral membrane protein (TIGR02206 family)